MLDLNEHVNHLRAVLQCRFQCGRSRVGPEILPVSLWIIISRKWLWWWSWDYTLRSFKTMVRSFLVLLEITSFNPAKHCAGTHCSHFLLVKQSSRQPWGICASFSHCWGKAAGTLIQMCPSLLLCCRIEVAETSRFRQKWIWISAPLPSYVTSLSPCVQDESNNYLMRLWKGLNGGLASVRTQECKLLIFWGDFCHVWYVLCLVRWLEHVPKSFMLTLLGVRKYFV